MFKRFKYLGRLIGQVPADRGAPIEIDMYTRNGCCLCDSAQAELDRLRSKYPFNLRLIDIDQNPDLVRQYGECVPVLVIEGRERFRGRINRVLLERQLRALSGQNR